MVGLIWINWIRKSSSRLKNGNRNKTNLRVREILAGGQCEAEGKQWHFSVLRPLQLILNNKRVRLCVCVCLRVWMSRNSRHHFYSLDLLVKTVNRIVHNKRND